MLKMRIFLKHTTKIASASGALPPNSRLPLTAGGSAPKPPRGYSPLILQLCRVCFYRLMRFITLEKEQNNSGTCSTFTSSALLRLFFTLNSAVFMTGGAKTYLAPGRRIPYLRH